MSKAIVVWAKAPIPGLVKTRLCPPLSHEQAAALQKAMTLDKVGQALNITDARVYVACYPPDAMDMMSFLPDSVARIPQRGDSLTERLVNCLTEMWDHGHRQVIFSDSDSPTLPCEAFNEAFRILDNGTDVCICPSEDGGYCFLGTSSMSPRLFEDIEWSTNLVAAQTLEIARELGLEVIAVSAGFDVDDASSLIRLVTELNNPHGPEIAVETCRWIHGNSALLRQLVALI